MKRTFKKMDQKSPKRLKVNHDLDWELIINIIKDKNYFLLGKGAYGEVYLINYKNTSLAIKVSRDDICTEEFYDLLNEGLRIRYPKSPFIVNYIGTHIDYTKWKVYIAMDYCKGHTLLHYMNLNSNIPEDKLKLILYSLLKGVEELNNNGLAHRDIKPSNILLTCKNIKKIGDVKLGDLGLQSRVNERKCVITRWYRPLEVELKYNYSFNIDIFSIGCIILELVTQRPILKSKGDREEHIKEIIKYFGNLPKELITFFEKSICNTDLLNFMKDYNDKYIFKNKFLEVIGNLKISKELKDIIKQCMELQPCKRPTAKKLLNNSYFDDFSYTPFNVTSPVIFSLPKKKTLRECMIIEDIINKFSYSRVTYLLSFDIYKKYSSIQECDFDTTIALLLVLIISVYNTDYDISEIDFISLLSTNEYSELYNFRYLLNDMIKVFNYRKLLPIGNYYDKLKRFNKSEYLLFLYLTEDNLCYNKTLLEKIEITKSINKLLLEHNNYLDIIEEVNINKDCHMNDFYQRIKISNLSDIIYFSV